MNINNVNNVGQPNSVQNVKSNPVRREVTPLAAQAQPKDRVELSSTATGALQRLKAGGDIRLDKVAAIKQQIADGTYLDDHKLDVAADRLLDDLLS